MADLDKLKQAEPLKMRSKLQFQANDLLAQLERQIAINRQLLEEVATDRCVLPTWHDVIAPWDMANAKLEEVWARLQLLSMTDGNNRAVQEAYDCGQQLMVAHDCWVWQHINLYQKAYRIEVEDQTLNQTQRYLLDRLKKHFQHAGVSLAPSERDRFEKYTQELAQLGSQFERNIVSDIERTAVHLNAQEALGLPDFLLAAGENLECELAQEESKRQEKPTSNQQLNNASASALEMSAANGGGLVKRYAFYLMPEYYILLLSHLVSQDARRRIYYLQRTIANGTNHQEVGDQAKSAERLINYDNRANHVRDKSESVQEGSPNDNSAIITRILQLRSVNARLLGYSDFVQFALTDRVAKNARQVEQFLLQLRDQCLAQAHTELAELQKVALQKDGVANLHDWDVRYYQELIWQERSGISEELERSYFPLEHVLLSTFRLFETLFAVQIEEHEPASELIWHPSVRHFKVYHQPDHAFIGEFYCDLAARPGKQSGAWAGSLRSRYVASNGELITPIGYLVTNFVPIMTGAATTIMEEDVDACNQCIAGSKLEKCSYGAALRLSHEELTTLLHEMGHLLQGLLSEIDYLGGSGTSGMPLDAVELTSQLMENWAWQPATLRQFTCHYQTGKRMPEELVIKLTQKRHFMAAHRILRQVEYALIDLYLHAHLPMRAEDGALRDAGADVNVGIQIKDVLSIAEQVRNITRLVPVAPPLSDGDKLFGAHGAHKTLDLHDNFLQTFSHIFAGDGYAAGYYSYLWAEVMATDIFELFKQKGAISRTLGLRFRREILAAGGATDQLELFRNFMGRDPDCGALLRAYQIASNGEAR